MTLISRANYEDFLTFNKKIEGLMEIKYNSLEEAAQKFIDVIYEEFKESVVLARIFVTVRFSALPDDVREFVTKMSVTKEVPHLLNDQTLVHCLLSTRGEIPLWNDRHHSRVHQALPLISADFVELIPMTSRLLKSQGVSLDWITSNDTKIVTKTMGNLAGLFYVPDAKTAVDEKGRKIIYFSDFVENYGVKTVFGFGGGYLDTVNSIIFVIFTRETIEEKKVEPLMHLVNMLRFATKTLVYQGKIFKQ